MKTLLPVLVGVTLALASAAGSAEETDKDVLKLSIERKSLRDALNDWAQQTGYQLIAEIKGDFAAPKIEGKLTAQEALEQLLQGTPLIYQWMGERLVAVREKPLVVPAALTSGEDEKQPALPIARLTEDPLSTRPFSGTAHVVAQSDAPAGMERRPQTGKTGVEQLEEIVVTGSRLKTTSKNASPVVVFNREKIEQLGVSSVPDVLRYLPQQSFNQAEEAQFSGAQFAQLRGLPTGSTVVLLNGRRMVPTAANINQNAFDLNTIPLAAVDRIEVLSESASAVYGADAMGGVINVILKKDITRPVVEMRYGSAEGGAEEKRVSLSSGISGDRFRGSLVFDYFDRNPLFGRDRDRWANQDYRRFGGTDRRSTITNPGNIASLTGENLPGLPASFAAVPVGSSGVGLTTDDFIGTAATENRESLRQYESIVLDRERRSVGAFADLDLTPHAGLFVEALYTDESNQRESAPSLAFLLVPAENPHNPFGEPVLAQYLFDGLGPTVNTMDTDWYSATVGVRANLGSWDGELSIARSEGNSVSEFFANSHDQALVDASLASLDPNASLNVFQDGPGGTSSLLNSLRAEPFLFDDQSGSTLVTGYVRGAAFTLPGGAVEVVVGASRTEEEIEQHAPQFGIHTSADRSVSAGFSEIGVPLIGSGMQVAAVRDLTITVGARYDNYSDFGGSFNAQYGLIWAPTSSLTLRVSSGTSFSPPSLFYLGLPKTTIPGLPVMDPSRNNEIALVDNIQGGNPDLDPEEGRALTAGFIFSPASARGVRVAVSYWRVRIDDRISTLGLDQIVGHEELFADRVVRSAPTPADIAAGLPGALVSIDTSVINFARLKTSGVDLDLSCSFDTEWGNFSPSLAGTWTDSYETDDFPGVAPEERVGIAHLFGSIPEWKGVATLAWTKSGVGLSATARYIHGYKDAAITQSFGRAIPNGRRIPSQTLVDMQASIDMGEVMPSTSWLEGLKISAGAQNLFDKDPPFTDEAIGYDAYQGNLIGRSAYLSVSKRF